LTIKVEVAEEGKPMAWTEAVVVSVLRWVAWSGVAATVGLLEGETGPETGPVL
jgi:hypothetical protein